ncbi:glycoside hydrolase family 16 protein [Gloeophyllum trabeum ATCC 11539]|uniref:Glycoside hydrolase family 16 protein n=1 Tax=Gloeophyllum trabeum (strain ATCC 11539 / FP-39264 / Madison 617) TaxID=670483 RepID=S7Q230_GLOTA|nr:glycoside hydrolase family 16 protein [Gloeophyllum trabeum ATCC 11539]EPQ53587.1 glycoside hydrolase family 16 protein [Gloeophyllum trabeum ATCC 11539]
MAYTAQRRVYAAGSDSSLDNLLRSSPKRVPSPAARDPQPAYFTGSASLQSQKSNTSLSDSPYSALQATNGHVAGRGSTSEKFSLAPDPRMWGSSLFANQPEDDDCLHNPDPRRDRIVDHGGSIFSARGIANLGCIVILALAILGLFAGYPLASYFTKHGLSNLGGFNLGGINASGQVPSMNGNWGLIDLDTPQEALTHTSYKDGTEWQLVFSDEFNVEGRSFYPGDDPYWEAVNLNYWQTADMEWYDPDAITTSNGSLVITLSEKEIHDLNYQSGMMSTWNKFCFTGGMYLASVTLPGLNNVVGLWPAVWAMGNLGRAGYGASLDGMWPYTYDACDVGTVANQSINGVPDATNTLDPDNPKPLSFLPGQRLSRCTCKGESHPGPVHEDGTYVGRSAPEIDMFEAQISSLTPGGPVSGQVSQSAQWAPFNYNYEFFNTSDLYQIQDPTISAMNTYTGGELQQASSTVTITNQACYEGNGGCFSTYGFEYKPGFDDAYISWITDDKLAVTLEVAAMAADSRVNISARPVPQEPMYLIVNLGMSTDFTPVVDVDHIPFPVHMTIDWIRVYQPKDSINIGCDPQDFPTQAYINQYMEAYTNPNLTTWTGDFGQPNPKNSLIDQC